MGQIRWQTSHDVDQSPQQLRVGRQLGADLSERQGREAMRLVEGGLK